MDNKIDIKPGEVVYFKKMRKSTNKKAIEAVFPGYGFGIILGAVPEGFPAPPIQHVFRVLGSCGFFTFDDLKEFCGEEIQIKCVEGFKAKYYKENPAAKPETLKLV